MKLNTPILIISFLCGIIIGGAGISLRSLIVETQLRNEIHLLHGDRVELNKQVGGLIFKVTPGIKDLKKTQMQCKQVLLSLGVKTPSIGGD